MGDTCGPCFDRRADGGVPAGGFGQFNGWAGHYSRVVFSRDGTRLVGPAKALEMNLLGEPISAVEALEAGLVNQVVDDHELFETALSWARKAAGQAPLAMEQIKRKHGLE